MMVIVWIVGANFVGVWLGTSRISKLVLNYGVQRSCDYMNYCIFFNGRFRLGFRFTLADLQNLYPVPEVKFVFVFLSPFSRFSNRAFETQIQIAPHPLLHLCHADGISNIPVRDVVAWGPSHQIEMLSVQYPFISPPVNRPMCSGFRFRTEWSQWY